MDKKLNQTWKQIKDIKIQGATNVARAVAEALGDYAQTIDPKSRAYFNQKIILAGRYLLSARLTEPMADNAVEYIVYALDQDEDVAPEKLKNVVASAVKKFLKLMEVSEERLVRHGELLVKNGMKIMTHCHSSTVLKVLEKAKKRGKKFEVFQTETRPLMQGHKTAKDLLKMGIKDTLIVDSAAPYLLSEMTGEDFDIDMVIIGADAISADGSAVNKIGSYSIASAASRLGIPVYIATQALKINEDAKNIQAVKIEKRDADEVWLEAPKGLKIFNPAFDKIPAKYITGIITEFGIVKPNKFFSLVKSKYPFIFVK
jgi:ribose 1,5-bisphosphate isomerase